MDMTFLVAAFATLFVVIDPIGLTPIFVALTQGMDPKARRIIGLRACLIGFSILLVFAFTGEALLEFLGISMAAFRIAGGLLLFLTALEMLFEFRTKKRQDRSEDVVDDPSVFPLAIPLIAGPGAIASMILLTGSTEGDWLAFGSVIAVMFCVVALVALFFSAAGLMERLLGRTGIAVVTRLLGMLLAALSVQFVLDGLRGFGLATG